MMPDPKEMMELMKKQSRINELIEIVGDNREIVGLDDFVNDNYLDMPDDKLFLKSKNTCGMFHKISQNHIMEIKKIIHTLGLKVKVYELGPSFPNEPILLWTDLDKMKIKYDIILKGNPINIWAFIVLFKGQWLEEYLAFIHDDKNPDLDKKWRIKSWNQPKYIQADLRDNIKELSTLASGSCAIHLPIIPIEMEIYKRKRVNSKNIGWFKLEVFRGLNADNSIRQSFRSFDDKVSFFTLIFDVINFGMLHEELTLKVNQDGYMRPNMKIREMRETIKKINPSSKRLQWLNIWFDFDEGDANVSC